MSAKIDLTGKKFGKLYVLREDGRIRKEAAWLCVCSCGMRKTMKQWSEFLNVPYGTLQRKAKQGKAGTFLKGRLNASA